VLETPDCGWLNESENISRGASPNGDGKFDPAFATPSNYADSPPAVRQAEGQAARAKIPNDE